MRTPFDTALRLATRKVETVRIAIGDAVNALQRIEDQHLAADRALRDEGLLAANDPRLTTQHFFLRARDQRQRLAREREAVHAGLEKLRRQAVENYGALSTMENAVTRYHEDADRAANAAEQAAIDDLTSARYIRESGARRQAAQAAGSPP